MRILTPLGQRMPARHLPWRSPLMAIHAPPDPKEDERDEPEPGEQKDPGKEVDQADEGLIPTVDASDSEARSTARNPKH